MILWKLVKSVNLEKLAIQTFFVLFSSNLASASVVVLISFSTRALDDLKGENRKSVDRLAILVMLTGLSGMILW